MLLIMGCSGRKQDGENAATTKYLGRQHDVARSFAYCDGIEVAYLSAEFGLIDFGHPLPDYDRKMDAMRALSLVNDPAQRDMARRLGDGHDTVAVFGGKVYREAVKALFPEHEVVEVVGEDRGCGDHFSALRNLLPGEDD